MKKLILVVTFILACFTTQAQEYRTHRVEAGETIESIAKKYLVTPFDIYALNPDAKNEVKPSMMLIIPKSKLAETPTTTEERQLLGFKRHKVKRKETLYSISKKFNVPIEDIKKHNKRLYSENLRKGDRIQIPEYKIIVVENPLENTLKRYTVLPKEGKWRIAYKFGISVDELERINPNLPEVLKVGQEINVPNIANNEEKEVDEDYGYYVVEPKEGFYRLKVKLGLEQEQLEELNPELKEGGLKAGMVLKVPKSTDIENMMEDFESQSLLGKLKNFDTKRIAVMLPFRTNRIDLDSLREARETLENDRYMSIAVDFHSGVLMALDSAKQLGISTYLDVFDTEARVSRVSQLISNNDFSTYDAVIGPFTMSGFDRLAASLKNDNVPVISAVTKPKELYKNVFQTIPNDTFLKKQMISFVQNQTEVKNVLIIADSKHREISNELARSFTGAKQIFSRKNKDGKESYYVLKDDILNNLVEGKNVVFLETNDEGFVSNVASMLSALNGKDFETEIERELILMTTDHNRAFESDNISNMDLSNLKFHYPSVNRGYQGDDFKGFREAYKRLYQGEPNRYVIRGFDVTMDLLLRLTAYDDFYEATPLELETEYIANKFRYNKKLFGGYYNESGYIVKYDNLDIVEVKQ